VQESVEDLPENEVALTYKIDEGKKVYIRNIQFEEIPNSRIVRFAR